MIAYFFRKTGHVAIVPLEQRRTNKSEWYPTICWPVQEIRKTNHRRRITLHHDNVSSHTSTANKLHFWAHKTSIWCVTRHIVLIWLSVRKNKMTGELFSSPKEAVDEFRREIWRYLNQNGKSASTIGLNACKNV